MWLDAISCVVGCGIFSDLSMFCCFYMLGSYFEMLKSSESWSKSQFSKINMQHHQPVFHVVDHTTQNIQDQSGKRLGLHLPGSPEWIFASIPILQALSHWFAKHGEE